jgi:serine/threonine-protein kinase
MMRCTSCGDSHPTDATLCPRTGQPVGSGPCGSRIDRYEVEKLLGDGGMGAVYKARHAMLNQHVAIKLLHAEFARRGDMLERFLREARAAATVGNPHIIRVHDCGATADGRPFLVMELLEGEGVETLLRRERRVSPPRAVALVTQVLDGLEAAHTAGIIHRDMKPANVFIRRTPDPATPEFVTVLDFGISKMSDPSGAQQQITQTGTMIGTPVYMAPEQIMSPKEVDRRVDIYATGVMLYEMLSGRLPYDGANTAELIVKACTMPPTPLLEVAPDVPPGLVAVVDQALAREPSQRFQTAAAFADALRRSLGGGHSLPTSPQGSGAQGWAPTALAMPVTAVPAMSTPVGTQAMTPPPVTSQPWPQQHPSNLAAPHHATMHVPQGPSNSGTSTTKVILIVLGVVVGLAGMCCVGTLLIGYFAADQATSPPRQTPEMTPIPAPQSLMPSDPPPAPTAPAPPPAPSMTGVTIDPPQIVGLLPVDAIEQALQAAAPAMAGCGTASPQTVSVLAIVQPNGAVPIARPADGNEGDRNVAQCVGNRFAAQRVASGGTSGIVTFTAHVPARP